MAVLLLTAAFCLFSVAHCGDFTVTDEAWFDVKVKDLDGPGQDFTGRFVVALFGDTAPMTTMNFKHITKGYQRGGETLHYKGTNVHRIVTDFVIQMGDITIGDGTGGKSIYGERFNDEQFILSHRSPGWVAMANHGPDTNGSQFYILMVKARWLDGNHVVFGKVIRGMDVIRTLGDVATNRNTAVPLNDIEIIDCGMNELDRKYDLTEDQLDATYDL